MEFSGHGFKSHSGQLSIATSKNLSVVSGAYHAPLKTISAVTWQTVHEDIVADAFYSKKISSALLAHKQQSPQK